MSSTLNTDLGDYMEIVMPCPGYHARMTANSVTGLIANIKELLGAQQDGIRNRL